MIISERIFKVLKDKNMTQMEFAKRAGFREIRRIGMRRIDCYG